LPAHLLVVGSINMDIIVRCQAVPRAGQTVAGEEFRTAPGGKGGNQAVACARLGAQTNMVGRVGSDEFGSQLHAGLGKEGVGVTSVRVDQGAATGVAVILLEAGGENRIVVVGGANRRLADEDLASVRELLRGAHGVVMSLEVPLAFAKAVAEAAKGARVPLVLDAGPATPDVARIGLPALVDVLSPNESEAEVLTGVGVVSVVTAERAAGRLLEQGAREVVLKLGALGAYWAGSDGGTHFPAFAIQPVDTTAAGDAFTACLAVGLAEGTPMAEAIRRANAAGALACLRIGAQPSMPTRTAVEQFLQDRPGEGLPT
jgi:ribokinase